MTCIDYRMPPNSAGLNFIGESNPILSLQMRHSFLLYKMGFAIFPAAHPPDGAGLTVSGCNLLNCVFSLVCGRRKILRLYPWLVLDAKYCVSTPGWCQTQNIASNTLFYIY